MLLNFPQKTKFLTKYFFPHTETSYTYAQFQKTGKLVSPATVIPRFRKYNVEDFHFLTVLGKGSFGKVSKIISELGLTFNFATQIFFRYF